jgi:hypothetical protein
VKGPTAEVRNAGEFGQERCTVDCHCSHEARAGELRARGRRQANWLCWSNAATGSDNATSKSTVPSNYLPPRLPKMNLRWRAALACSSRELMMEKKDCVVDREKIDPGLVGGMSCSFRDRICIRVKL